MTYVTSAIQVTVDEKDKGAMALAGIVATTTVVALAAWSFSVTADSAVPDLSYRLPASTQTTTGPNALMQYGTSTESFDNRAVDALHLVMGFPAVSDFKRLVPSVDIGAVQGIYDLALKYFSTANKPSVQFSLEAEESGPALFLSLDTHGMDFEEQLQREIVLREEILRNPRFALTKPQVVISVV